jgi:multimeric flavodoxin WrbA
MKVVAICGSPRKGNTEDMLKEALKGAESAGAKTSLILLRKHKLKLPTGNAMPTGKNLKKLHDEMRGASAIIFGTPCYYNNMSALMKIFVDRMDPIWNSKEFKGKKAGIVAVGAADKKSIDWAIKTLKEVVEILEMKFNGSVMAIACDAGEIKKNKLALKKCFELGKKLVSV